MVLRGGGGEAPFAMNEGVPRCARCARRRRGVSRRRSLPSSFAERRWRRRVAAELCGLGEGKVRGLELGLGLGLGIGLGLGLGLGMWIGMGMALCSAK